MLAPRRRRDPRRAGPGRGAGRGGASRRGARRGGGPAFRGDLSAERWRAVARGRTGGLYFERLGREWTWREVEDGNGNGLRTAEIRSGRDPSRRGLSQMREIAAGTAIGVPPGGPYPEAPPGEGTIGDGDDPVRFGASDIVSFSPDGRSSSGTLYVTDRRTRLYAIVLFGPTARVRVWRWDRASGTWRL